MSNQAVRPSENPRADVVIDGEHVVHAVEGTLTVVDHGLTVQRTGSERVFTLRAGEVRRIQLDIELRRPATMAIVPDSAGLEAQVLTIEPDQFEALSKAMLHIAVALADVSRRLAD